MGKGKRKFRKKQGGPRKIPKNQHKIFTATGRRKTRWGMLRCKKCRRPFFSREVRGQRIEGFYSYPRMMVSISPYRKLMVLCEECLKR